MRLGEAALRYTLCFLTRTDRVLMLRRRRAPKPARCDEGDLAWMPCDEVLSSADVVSNIHRFGPEVLAGMPPRWHRFAYRNGAIESYGAAPVSAFPGFLDSL